MLSGIVIYSVNRFHFTFTYFYIYTVNINLHNKLRRAESIRNVVNHEAMSLPTNVNRSGRELRSLEEGKKEAKVTNIWRKTVSKITKSLIS